MSMQTQTQLVGEAVRAEMVRSRVTQAQVASALGKTQQVVSAKLCGKTVITVNELTAIAQTLGVDPRSLLVEQQANAS